MKITVYNQQGKETGQVLLPKEVFGLEINPDLIYQVVTSQMANQRQILAKAKGRGEVRGGGRKPWRQKGTGRARHGSIRSPLFKGGGVIFGPTTEIIFKKKINKKMRRKALLMLFSTKAKEKLLLILDNLKIAEPKTKLMFNIVKNLKAIFAGNKNIKDHKKETILVALAKKDDNIIRASRNIPWLKTTVANDLNGLDLISFKYLIMPREAIKVIEETFIKNPKS